MTRGITRGWRIFRSPLALVAARETGADAAEVVSFALPFGGPPGRKGSSMLWRQVGFASAATLAVVVMIGAFFDWETAFRVAATITGAVATVAFWGYLGFRAPK